MLIGRDTATDRTHDRDLGAHGYLVKPFSFEDLLARVRAMGRRPSVGRHIGLEVGDLASTLPVIRCGGVRYQSTCRAGSTRFWRP